MANILTKFIPDLYQAMDEVSRELVGFIPSVARNSSATRAALNESVIIPISQASSASDVAPAMTVPEPSDFAPGYTELKITKSKAVSFGLNGEEYVGLDNGLGARQFMMDEFKQGVRTLTNLVEADIAAEAGIAGSRAYGTTNAGGTAFTTPFASSLADAAQLRKILDDNGAPMGGRSLIIDTAAGVNLRSLAQLTDVDRAGDTMTLRQGELLPLFGFSVKESAQIVSPAVGDASGFTVKGATAIGATTITLKAATSGALKAGDYITIAGDANKYLVTKAVTGAANATFTIAAPGLRVAAADEAAISVVIKSVRNVGFAQNAIQLVTRAPALPGGIDSAVDSYMMTDPRSGLGFEIRVYEGYRKLRAEVALAWGVKAIKPEHIACLLG